MAKVTESPHAGMDTRIEISSGKKPNDKDYLLSGIRIRPATNTEGGKAVIVSCSYEIKEDVKKKMRAKENYCDTYRPDVEHVADDYDKGIDFIIAEMQKLKSDSAKS